SSDEDVVTVDDEGNVTAVAAGTATITATAGDVSATCDVTVIHIVPAEEEEISAEYTIAVGDTLDLDEENPVDVKWESSDPEIAAITDEGVVTGKAAGVVTITATAEDGGKTITTVNVVKAE
ncbi:MAG: Ig-like domain-containing protein, partial [Clostridia bacterium]|nr:Ig-like domain-containing protein [Clostridia bacterium]